LTPKRCFTEVRLTEVAEARKAPEHAGHRELEFSVAEIGRYLSISGPAVSQMFQFLHCNRLTGMYFL
jgi:hypothetical protein